MAFSNGPTVVTSGLILSLDAADRNSYPGSGDIWYDLSGNRYNFRGSGSYGFSNNAIVFNRNNAANTGTVFTLSNLPNQLKIENFLANNCTIEVWYQPQTLSGSNFDATETAQSLVVWPGYHNGKMTPSILISTWNSALTSNYVLSLTGSASTVRYNHNVSVINYQTTQSTGYVNGVLNIMTGSVPPRPTMTSAQGIPANTLNIGAARNSDNYRLFFTGSIAIVRLYNRALSASEVQQNYNAVKSRFGL